MRLRDVSRIQQTGAPHICRHSQGVRTSKCRRAWVIVFHSVRLPVFLSVYIPYVYLRAHSNVYIPASRTPFTYPTERYRSGREAFIRSHHERKSRSHGAGCAKRRTRVVKQRYEYRPRHQYAHVPDSLFREEAPVVRQVVDELLSIPWRHAERDGAGRHARQHATASTTAHHN